ELDLLYRQGGIVPLMTGPDPVFEPTELVAQPYPRAEFDFSFGASMATYNWEIFFHMPLYIAERFMAEYKFEEAQQWFHYIFDPGALRSASGGADDSKAWWRVRPLHEAETTATLSALYGALSYTGSAPAQLRERELAEAELRTWQENPFRPHAVARMRPQAYQRYVVMRYLDLLIAWGDYYFAQDTIESTNEALTHYLLAKRLLG